MAEQEENLNEVEEEQKLTEVEAVGTKEGEMGKKEKDWCAATFLDYGKKKAKRLWKYKGEEYSTTWRLGRGGFIQFLFENGDAWTSEITNDLADIMAFSPPPAQILRLRKDRGQTTAHKPGTAEDSHTGDVGHTEAEGGEHEEAPTKKRRKQQKKAGTRRGSRR